MSLASCCSRASSASDRGCSCHVSCALNRAGCPSLPRGSVGSRYAVRGGTTMSTMLHSPLACSFSCSSPTVNGMTILRVPATILMVLVSKSNVALCLDQKSLPRMIGTESLSMACHSCWKTCSDSPSVNSITAPPSDRMACADAECSRRALCGLMPCDCTSRDILLLGYSEAPAPVSPMALPLWVEPFTVILMRTAWK